MILTIGCSHSLGEYYKNDNLVNFASIENGVCTNQTTSWSYAIHHRTSKTVRHLGLIGQGIISYLHCLQQLEKHNLLVDVDTLVVQYTQEPRIISHNTETRVAEDFFDNKIIRFINLGFENNYEHLGHLSIMPMDYPNSLSPYNHSSHTIIPHVLNGKFNENKLSTHDKLLLSETLTNMIDRTLGTYNYKIIFDSVKNEIIRLCERNNIRFFDFAWTNSKYSRVTESGKLDTKNPQHVIISDEENFTVKRSMIEYIQKNYNIDSYEDARKEYETVWTNRSEHQLKTANRVSNKLIMVELARQGLFDV